MRRNTTFFLLLLPFILLAQTDDRSCHTSHLHAQHLAENPTFKQEYDVLEAEIAHYLKNGLRTRSAKITIPVVVHIVYRTTEENISDAQVRSQIDALNQDFNKLNKEILTIPDHFKDLVADCDIEFQLSVRDPQGNPSYGIQRHFTNKLSWGVNDDIKTPLKGGFAPWNAQKYLNIYVANLSSKSLGFSSFPGALDAVDGVVISYKAFGTQGTAVSPFNLGRTCAHEIGHWLGLHHIWGDADCGDDRIEDTPTQKQSSKRCPTFPQYSTCGGAKTIDMTMNFMDYSDDACMYMFSKGQKARMWAILETRRSGLFSSDALMPPANRSCMAKNLQSLKIDMETATIGWDAVAGVAKYTVEYRETGQNAWKITQTTMPYIQLDSLKKGTNYDIRVKTDCVNAVYSNIMLIKTSDSAFKLIKSEEKETMTIAPNPVSSFTEITINGDKTQAFSVSVYDIRGVLKSTEILKANTPSVFLDFSNYPQGVYTVVVVKKNARLVQKVVKIN